MLIDIIDNTKWDLGIINNDIISHQEPDPSKENPATILARHITKEELSYYKEEQV